MSAWDNATDDELLALSPAGLQMRVCLYTLVAADYRTRNHEEYAEVRAALDRAVRIWKQRGEPMPLSVANRTG